MAISAATELKILIKTAGEQGLHRLSRQLTRLGTDTVKTNFQFDKFTNALKRQEAQRVKSINNTRAFSDSWKELAASVEFGSREFREATAEAKRLDAQLSKMGGTRAGNKWGQRARTAGAVAGSAVFGGPEGAIGAGIGAIVGGGPAGALVGGAIGAQAGMFRRSLGEIAEYKAALDKQRLALKLVVKDSTQYAKSQKFLLQTSRDLAIPQDVIIRQFTSLTASVKGAGLEVNDAEKAFTAIASGIRGTGGSLEDMRAAMVATAQVFSKGKVSAEELRQQLGERLPGAFTIFAESMGKTPAELDKALEGGKVTLQDFMVFVDELTKRYEDNAKQLADAPATAGDRLAQAMSELKDNLAGPLSAMGAMFQDMATTAVTALNDITVETKTYAQRLTEQTLRNQIENAEFMLDYYEKLKVIADSNKEGNILERVFGKKLSDKDYSAGIKMYTERLEAATEALDRFLNKSDEVTEGSGEKGDKKKGPFVDITAGAKAYIASVTDFAKQTQDIVTNAFKGMEDALVEFVTKGTLDFKRLAQSIIADIARIAIRASIVAPLKAMLGFKDGGVFAQNGIVPFARGGIVNSPTVFPFANGIGLMGEAGPEAIMPLRRGPSGRLGVEAGGGTMGGINVNVDASGSSVEGDEQQSKELGRLIGVAIQSELIRQKRPGGILG
tara:strand:+ start:2230 stop:4242 length:2013 start_codon:yes stop_codon:yes gene_type:complete